VKTVCHKRRGKSSAEYDFLGKTIAMDWNGGNISSDGGLLVISRLLKKAGIINKISHCIEDRRDQEHITHTISELIGQRVSQLMMG
jgi:hypothetical protein